MTKEEFVYLCKDVICRFPLIKEEYKKSKIEMPFEDMICYYKDRLGEEHMVTFLLDQESRTFFLCDYGYFEKDESNALKFMRFKPLEAFVNCEKFNEDNPIRTGGKH